MSDYRRFWLLNALGNRYDFTETTAIFLESPTGLGFKRSYSYVTVGNSQLITSQQFDLTDIQGSLLFMGETNGVKYQAYQDFIQFVKYRPIEFHYQTPNDLKSYHCNVLFTQADKGEVSQNGILSIPVTFHRLTQWLTDEEVTYTFDNTPIGDGKYYDLVYDYYYSGTNLSDGRIVNSGTDEVGFIIEINGGTDGVMNPQFTLTQSGETYGICKINGTYDYVRITSIEKEESIYLEQGGVSVTNPEQYQDFTVGNGIAYLTWCKLRVGETQFKLTYGNTDPFDGDVTIRFQNSFASI